MKFPAIGMEIDGKFVIDVDCQLDAGGDKDRIETLRLALPQPLGRFIAAAARGFAQHVFAGFSGDDARCRTGIIDQVVVSACAAASPAASSAITPMR